MSTNDRVRARARAEGHREHLGVEASCAFPGVGRERPDGPVVAAVPFRDPFAPSRAARRPTWTRHRRRIRRPASGHWSPGRWRRRWQGRGRHRRPCSRSRDGSGRRSAVARPPGCPGPASSTVSRTRPPSAADRDGDRAPVRRVLAGVVEQDAEEAVEPVRRRGDHGVPSPAGRRAGGRAGALGDDPRTDRRSGPRARQVDGLGVGRLARRVEPASQSRSSSEPAHPLALDDRSW